MVLVETAATTELTLANAKAGVTTQIHKLGVGVISSWIITPLTKPETAGHDKTLVQNEEQDY